MSDDLESWYARPVFFVTDCERALDFYGKLGFHEAWRHEDEGRLIALQVNRGWAELILNENAMRAGGGRLFLSLRRGQVAQCVARFSAAGVDVLGGYWGMPVKSISDPDGNDLLLHDDALDEIDA